MSINNYPSVGTRVHAVSLIEMMLVVTILAVISVGGIQGIRNSSDVPRLEKTAQQYQNIAVAARNYYEKYRTWPTMAQLNSYVGSSFFSQVNGVNGWGNAITLTAPTPPAMARIHSTIPSKIATKKLFAKLPFSHYDPACNSNCTLSMYFNKPIKAAWDETLVRIPIIKNITPLRISSSVYRAKAIAARTTVNLTVPNCIGGYTPRTMVGLVRFGRPTNPTKIGSWIGRVALCTRESNDSVCLGHKPSGEHQVKMRMFGETSNIAGEAEIIEVGYCEPV